MRTFMGAVVGAVLLAVFFAAVPAYADCAADIKELESRLDGVPENKQVKETIRSRIHEAKTALADGKKKRCEKKVALAKKALDKTKN